MSRTLTISRHKIQKKTKLTNEYGQVSILITQGLALHHEKKFIEAKAVYEKVLKIQPKNFDALQLLGTLSAQMEDFKKAIDFLDKALQINP